MDPLPPGMKKCNSGKCDRLFSADSAFETCPQCRIPVHVPNKKPMRYVDDSWNQPDRFDPSPSDENGARAFEDRHD